MHKYFFIRLFALLFTIVIVLQVSGESLSSPSPSDKIYFQKGFFWLNQSISGDLAIKKNITESYIDIQRITGLNGTGIKIGVISDGVSHLDDAINAGALSDTVHILRTTAPGGDEGTAILEVLHRIAPGAELYFVSHGRDKTEFRDGVGLLVENGCKIICDDVVWREVPYFEDDWLTEFINTTIKEKDLLYIIGAGNDGLRHYQALYYNNGTNFHDFSRGTIPKNESPEKFLINLPPYGNTEAILQWDDPWEKRENEFRLYIVDEENTLLIKNDNPIWRNKNPFERVVYVNPFNKSVNLSLFIEKRNVTNKTGILELFIFSPALNPAIPDKRFINASDAIYGHRSSPLVTSVGAAASDFPDIIEVFSSQGPVTNKKNGVKELINKPDIIGIDNISVSGAGGFGDRFYGTSASVPYIAGISALIWSENLTMNASYIRDAMYKSAIDLGKPGWDPVYGYGRLDAVRMYMLLNAFPVPGLNIIVPSSERVVYDMEYIVKDRVRIPYIRSVNLIIFPEATLFNGSKYFFGILRKPIPLRIKI